MRGPTQEATGIGPMMMAHIATRTRTGGDISMMDETTGFTSQYIRVTIVLLTIKHYGLFIYFGLLFVRHTIFPGAVAMALKPLEENPTAGTMTTSPAQPALTPETRQELQAPTLRGLSRSIVSINST